MRILILNNEFPPLGGGTGTVNRAILDRLLTLEGWTIDLITSALGREREEVRYAPDVRLIKVPVNSRNIHHSTGVELLRYGVRALREALLQHDAAPYDACFAWSTVPAGWVARCLKRKRGLRYVVRVCGVDIPGFETRYRCVYPFLTPVLRSIWREAERVVAKCRGEVDMLQSTDPTIEPRIVYNGVNMADFRRSVPPRNDEQLRLVCVGRLIERKGQRDLIEAVERLQEKSVHVHVSLVGTGDSEAAYRQMVNERGLSERVEFCGYVPREHISEQYSRAHAFVLPSYNEGMSVSTLEAMASGLPLVVSRTGGVEELVDEGENGMVFRAGDTDQLTSCLESLATDHSLVAKMGKSSLSRAAAFSWDNATEAFVQMLQDVAVGRTVKTGMS